MVIIRRALEEDLAGIAALAARLVRYHHDLDPLRFMNVPDAADGYRHFLRGEMRSGDTVILGALRETEAGMSVVGYTYARVEPRNWNDLLDRCGRIHDVFVAEDERRQGIARKLLAETIRHLEELGAPRIVLHTAMYNGEAQELFTSFGFRTTMLEMTRETQQRAPRRSTFPPPES
ncbi:GNAT family N-acetyltransferase [Pendulispora brunnea]|uniref:GNAT family N-acetyltransferase n=1 Tax=Pendulispora brunnea TaxID=2905690 RepID=A0ABZ2KEA3_9BACT